MGSGRQRIHRHAVRVLVSILDVRIDKNLMRMQCRQPGTLPSPNSRHPRLPSAEAHALLPGVLQLRIRGLRQVRHRALRLRICASDEHGRGGRRDGHQAREEVGVSRFSQGALQEAIDGRDRYKTKGVPEGKAIILSAAENFHGRTLGVIRCVASA
jgi:hypothetical protein